MSICDECVFKYMMAERGQDACAYCDGEVEAVKACVSAHIFGRCEKKMTRADVKELVRKNEEAQERLHVMRAFLNNLDKALYTCADKWNRRADDKQCVTNKRKLEELLNRAAYIFDAPGMDKVAEYLIENNVVVLPCRVGDKLYTIYDGTDEDKAADTKIEELTVTEVGLDRIFCSSCVPPEDDIDYEIPISEIGERYFFTREDAEEKMKGGDG